MFLCSLATLPQAKADQTSDVVEQYKLVYGLAGLIGNYEWRCFKSESVNKAVTATFEHNKFLKQSFQVAFVSGGLAATKGVSFSRKYPEALSCDNEDHRQEIKSGVAQTLKILGEIKTTFPSDP